MPDYMRTANEFTDAISNLENLIKLYQNKLELRDIFNYDTQQLGQTPALSIVFESGIPISKSLGGRCNLMNVNVVLFMYLDSLNLGVETFEHIGRLGYLVKLLYINDNLFGLCASEPLTIRNSQIVGRRLESDIYLTAQVDLTVPIRFCKEIRP